MGQPTAAHIDSGIELPLPAHMEANRKAAAAWNGRATGSGRFDEAKWKALRGGYRRFPPDYSRRNERPAPDAMPMPLWRRKHGFSASASNCSPPSSDLKAFADRWFEEQREANAAQRRLAREG